MNEQCLEFHTTTQRLINVSWFPLADYKIYDQIHNCYTTFCIVLINISSDCIKSDTILFMELKSRLSNSIVRFVNSLLLFEYIYIRQYKHIYVNPCFRKHQVDTDMYSIAITIPEVNNCDWAIIFHCFRSIFKKYQAEYVNKTTIVSEYST